MSVFKLIKEYPNSPKIGYITVNPQGFHGVIHCSNHPEYWEEIIKYPIGTKVLNNQTNTIYTKEKDGWYTPGTKTAYTDDNISKSKYINIISEEIVEKEYEILSIYTPRTKEILTDSNVKTWEANMSSRGQWVIHSVKRLSDGEIFTVGDKVERFCNQDIIKSFNLYSRIGVTFSNGSQNHLNNMQHIKQPLFTTEDGVDIFEGNKSFGVTTRWVIIPYDGNKYGVRGSVFFDNKWFSTEDAAKEYILMNKPLFTATDILLYLDIFGNIVKDVQKERVKTIAKSKL